MHGQVRREFRPKNFSADITFGVGLIDSRLDDLDPVIIFATDVQIRGIDPHGIARDDDSFDHQMRIELENLPVLERAGFAFISVHTQILRLRIPFRHECPLQARRKAGSAATAQAGLLDFVRYFLGFHPERFAQHLIAAIRFVHLDPVEIRNRW